MSNGGGKGKRTKDKLERGGIKEEEMTAYIIVIAILSCICIYMLLIKKKINWELSAMIYLINKKYPNQLKLEDIVRLTQEEIRDRKNRRLMKKYFR